MIVIFYLLSYDTPINLEDEPDITILNDSINDLGHVMKKIILHYYVSSQSPIGVCRKLRNSLQKINADIELAYSPENLQLGDAINRYLDPEG